MRPGLGAQVRSGRFDRVATRILGGARASRRRAARIAAVAVLGALCIGAPGMARSSAAPTAAGREWRELTATIGLSRAQLASVCPTNGVTPCSGTVGGVNLTGWVWATSGQVRGLLDDYAPALATASPPYLQGPSYFVAGAATLNAFAHTQTSTSELSHLEAIYGWTASLDSTGRAIIGSAGYQTPVLSGFIGMTTIPATSAASAYRGVWMWRPAGVDYTPPVVSGNVSGTLGTNGWYRSSINISWTVTDPESAIVSTSGCGARVVGVDTSGSTFTCTATSAGNGGPASASVTVKRDVAAPSATCLPAPTFELGQVPAPVVAVVADLTSGPVSPSVTRDGNTATAGTKLIWLTGTDNAGNTRSVQCAYSVVTPQCQGRIVTIFGTKLGERIVGTEGADVIHGLYGGDNIDGRGGNDVICGGGNNDIIAGGAGNDLIDGGIGDDTIFGGDGDDTLLGGPGVDELSGEAGADTCSGGELGNSSCTVV